MAWPSLAGWPQNINRAESLQQALSVMNDLENRKTSCPYCGETIDMLIDCSVPQQDYIEDCQVCCRPIAVAVSIDQDGSINLMIRHEND